MPITAKLSREFYERFGDKVVNEMVDLFNRIDDAARSDLRLFNEQNALRFEAKLDQRTAELRAEIEKLGARFDSLERDLKARIEVHEKHIALQMNGLAADLKTTLEKSIHAHTRWIVAMWATVIASQIGLWLR